MYGYGRGWRGQSSDPGDRSEGVAVGPAPPVLFGFRASAEGWLGSPVELCTPLR